VCFQLRGATRGVAAQATLAYWRCRAPERARSVGRASAGSRVAGDHRAARRTEAPGVGPGPVRRGGSAARRVIRSVGSRVLAGTRGRRPRAGWSAGAGRMQSSAQRSARCSEAEAAVRARWFGGQLPSIVTARSWPSPLIGDQRERLLFRRSARPVGIDQLWPNHGWALAASSADCRAVAGLIGRGTVTVAASGLPLGGLDPHRVGSRDIDGAAKLVAAAGE